MSHSTGAVRFEDGEVMYYEYDGTADIVCSALGTREEVSENWRKPQNDRTCSCGKKSEPVEIMSTYGGGFYWNGMACRKCKSITGGYAPYGYGYEESDAELPKIHDGYPDWFPKI